MKLPDGQHVKLSPDGDRFRIVTARLGFTVGPRLDRGRGEYPAGPIRGLTFQQASAALPVWEKFCADQEPEGHRKREAKKSARNDFQADANELI